MDMAMLALERLCDRIIEVEGLLLKARDRGELWVLYTRRLRLVEAYGSLLGAILDYDEEVSHA